MNVLKIFGKKKEEKKEDIKKETEEKVELSLEAVEQVSGGGNPFEGEDRVPTQPIDDDLRKKG